jgi:hypothetical protein
MSLRPLLLAAGLLAGGTGLSEAQPPPGASDRLGDAWSDPRNPIVRIFAGERLELWSLKPVTQRVPAGGGGEAPGHPIDRFLAVRWGDSGLTPVPEADRRTLIRRLTFDLTGLPPTPEEVDAFVQDRSPDAYERRVDRLLASPRYGEHQARLWLDVVRYSDSNGFDWDEFRKQAWRYRDYVIRAFNTDKPFDRFIREQLAGDELLDGPPRTPEEQDQLIATTYLRLGPHDNAAPLFNEQDRSRAELMADLVETTGSAFLGLTLSCCRCHDHKYDPLSQADHFRLRAFFEAVKFADDLPLDLAEVQAAITTHNATVDAQLQPLEKQLADLLDSAKRRLRDERISRLAPDDQAVLQMPKAQLSKDQEERVQTLERDVEPSDKDVRAGLSEPEKERRTVLETEIGRIGAGRRAYQRGLLMTDAEGTPPVTRILFQGNHQQPRASVEPGFLSVLDPNPAPIRRGPNPKTTGRRLTLADWIASPTNPLTARVFVNRVWQQHFGRGLTATPNDFGLAGERPTHPELLDWLAGQFVRDGWSVKQLHRLIVTSEAYRRDSRVPKSSDDGVSDLDPGNALYGRQNPRRLTAEQLRDAVLATAGRLQLRSEGPPVWPELPPDILQANPAFLDDNETRTKGWYPSSRSDQDVRSVFLIQKRTVRVPFMETFDLPENSTSCATRTASVVAPQALSLLNSPLAVDAAEAFAGRVEREAGESRPAQVSRAFRIALQRPPTPDERDLSLRLVESRSLAELCRALLNLNEFAYLD